MEVDVNYVAKHKYAYIVVEAAIITSDHSTGRTGTLGNRTCTVTPFFLYFVIHVISECLSQATFLVTYYTSCANLHTATLLSSHNYYT